MKNLTIGLLIGVLYGVVAHLFINQRFPVEIDLSGMGVEGDDDEYAGNIWNGG